MQRCTDLFQVHLFSTIGLMLASEQVAPNVDDYQESWEYMTMLGNFLNASVIVLHKCETKGTNMFKS